MAAPRSLNMARTLPKTLPTTKLSPARSVPFCTSTVATGPRPRSSLASSTVPLAGRSGTGLEVLQVGNQADHFHQQVEIRLLLGGNVHEHRAAAPVLGHQATVRQLLLNPLWHGVGLVDLVDRDDDRHICCLGVINGFQRLRHHAVIGRNHQHHDVGDLRPTRAHAGEGLVTGRIEEDDLATKRRRVLVGDRHFVCADMLGDSARFAFGDAGQPDGIEQAGLAVIDVAHDGDHRRTRDRQCATLFASAFCRSSLLRHLLFEGNYVCAGPEMASHFGGEFCVERLVDGGENSARQQPGNQVLGANAQLLCQVLYAGAFRNRDVPRDGQRLAGKRQPWRRNEALHRAFLHATGHIALSRTRRTSHRTTGWRGRSCSDTCSCTKWRTGSRRSGTSWVRTTAFPGPHGRPGLSRCELSRSLPLTLRRHSRTRSLEDWFAPFGHSSSRRRRRGAWPRSRRRRRRIDRTRSGLRHDQSPRRWRPVRSCCRFCRCRGLGCSYGRRTAASR